MFRRGSALAFTFTAALRLGAPSATAPSGILPPGVHAFAGPAKPYRGTGGCSAYEREGNSSAAAHDDDKGAATGVLNKFFGINPDKKQPAAEDVTKDKVRYAIALAPDPKHTNLSVIFDREMSLIVQAAQDQGYDYNSSWLPWKKDETQGLTHLGDRQYADELADGREACPGVVLFRKRSEVSTAGDAYRKALVVFVVGEQPTGGINEDQWENTISWLTNNPLSPKLRSEDGVLRILGPTFTGSLVSLSRRLNEIYKTPEVKTPGPFQRKFPSARILSGSVTGCSAIRGFQSQIPALKNGHIDFGSFQENDAVHIFRFLEYLKDQGTEPSDTAILSEDETAYAAPQASSSPDRQCEFPYAQEDRPVHLVYPRDISALRNAYEKQAVFDSSSGGLKEHQHAILHEEAAPDGAQDEVTDTIPSASGSVAAVDQEAYLYGLVSLLRTHHSRYLILRCTNPLDFLFLTRFFHRAYPDARIVTVGSDMLYRREIDTTEFRGVLSLSSYPLLPRAQHWAKITEDDWETQSHNHLVFQSHLAEGMYIAARYVLQDDTLPESPGSMTPLILGGGSDGPLRIHRAFPTPDYSDPFWFHKDPSPGDFTDHPPTWITAVGRDGYWPIAVVGEDTFTGCQPPLQPGDKTGDAPPQSTMVKLQRPEPGQSVPPAKLQHYELKLPYADQPARDWVFSGRLLIAMPLAWLVCMTLALALVCYQLYGLLFAEAGSSNGILVVFRSAAAKSHAALLGMSCALALMPLIELCGVGFIPSHSSLDENAVYRLFCEGGFGLLCLLTIAGLLRRFRKESGRYRVWAAVVFAASIVALGGLYIFGFWSGAGLSNSVPLLYRMAHISEGTSPLVPVLLLSFGFYLWNWQAMAGNLNLVAGCPTLPEMAVAPGDPKWRLGRSCYRISQHLGSQILEIADPFCVRLRITIVPGFFIAAVVVCLSIKHTLPLLSLESQYFNWAINGLLLVALGLTATEALRMYSTWVTLRKLLQGLGRLRLRRTIARLRPIAANSIWSVSGSVHRIQYDLFAEQLDAAKRLLGLPPNVNVWKQLNQVALYGSQFIENTSATGGTGASWGQPVTVNGAALDMRSLLSDATGEVYNEVLRTAWESETESLNLRDPLCEDGEEDPDPRAMPLSKEPRVQAAEEFVAYHYIAFIQNIVSRMRTMTLSMIFLFIAVCFAISFYPFVPRTEIGVWLLINLALIGGAVAYVYAGMERDEVLSYIANTKPGRLGVEFWVKLAGFLAVPVIGILTTEFPSIADTFLQWLQPGLDAMK